MDILIVGLGNPGEKYKQNRHNVGFLFVEWLVQKEPSEWEYDKYTNAEVINIELSAKSYLPAGKAGPLSALLAKPQTFMNASGIAVRKLTISYKLSAMRLFIVHDDLDLPFGEFKITQGKGPKLHNGISSIEEALGTKDFWRIRIGIDNRDPQNRMPGEPYVLQNFTKEEMQSLPEIFNKISPQFLTKVMV